MPLLALTVAMVASAVAKGDEAVPTTALPSADDVVAASAEAPAKASAGAGASSRPGKDGLVDDPEGILNLDIHQLAKVDVVAPAMQAEVSTVARTESTVGKSSAAVFVVTNEMIRRSGARSVPEALRLVPGVNVARLNANRWAISVRGFNAVYANKLLVQVDGRSVYDPIFSGVYWDEQSLLLEDIERIEVIRGPGATVWGANAVNGVINIITKEARDTQGAVVTGGGGSFDRDFGAFRYGGRWGQDVHYRVYGKWDERESQPTGDSAFDHSTMGRSGFRMDWQPSECTTATFQGDFYEGRSGRANNVALPAPPFQLTGVKAYDEPSGANLLTRFSRKLSDDSDWSVQLYWDRTARPYEATDYPSYLQSQDTFDLDFQHRFPLADNHSLIWGFGYRDTRNVTDGNFTMRFDPPIRSFSIVSYFVQDQITLRDDLLYLTVGSKFQHNDFSGFEYQPTARLLLTPSQRQAAWASVSRAVRTPSRVDQDVRITGPMGENVPMFNQILGSPDVRSEELLAYEIGYRVQPTDAFWWDLAVFYNDYESLVTAVPGKSYTDPELGVLIFPATYTNAMRGDTYGFEWAGTYQVNPRWRLQTGYSFLIMNLKGIGSQSVERRSPRNQVYLQSGWDLGRGWELDMVWRYVDTLPAFATPSYTVMDVRLAWLPTRNLEMAVVGRNLLDGARYEFFDRSVYPSKVQQEVYGSVTWRY